MSVADIIVLAVLAISVGFVVRSLYKTHKAGGCAGCKCNCSRNKNVEQEE